ncbi:glycosyltransferase 87 family protein [Aciditerrimonas ferrireducens]|uniref:glycosyltransferase 87 family protein n=1 Tax=Aciditerrimonas ferrireducens TaxID=667306 RepID=UPI002005A14B|nr:glycosyltransferase 87 family protein [Aciditerrimonas ferrireducens]MCK4177855.1 glycosyltransferase 87 family protein [Aciditerrimonas ferrireducens]
MVRKAGRRLATAWTGLEPDVRDALLYGASAIFAGVVWASSGIALYRQWAELALGPYLAGTLASGFLAWRVARRRRAGRVAPRGHWTAARLVVFGVVLVGATLGPLSMEVLWRNEGVRTSTAHVQPEVEVIEAAGMRVAQGRDPYRLLNPHHLPPVPKGQPAYDAFDPYLPLMSIFGLARSTDAPPRLTDARVAFSVLTVLLVVVALALCRGPTGPKVLTLQAMTVLPTAALPLATGGDDLPVVALLLLGLVLLQRRRPLLGGLALGVAAGMKLTAWPLALLAPLVALDRQGDHRRARWWVAGGVLAVVVPSVLPSIVANPPAFFENVVRFPLGLAGITSPAATPLLGHVLVTAFPKLHRVLTAALVFVGGVVLLWLLVRRTPRTPYQLTGLLAWAMLVAIVLAPATRIGYALYPVDFFVWAWLLREEHRADEGRSVVAAAEAVLRVDETTGAPTPSSTARPTASP